MFWERKTTTTTTTPVIAPAPLYGPPAQPVVQTAPMGSLEAASTTNAATYTPSVAGAPVPVASVADAAATNTSMYNRPYEPNVPVPVESVTAGGMANVATADRTYQPDVRRSYTLTRITAFIYLFTAVLETLLAVRVILHLINANPAAGFNQFITAVTAPFVAPFAALMSNPGLANGSVLEITTLIAMVMYALLAWGIVRLVWILFERRVAR